MFLLCVFDFEFKDPFKYKKIYRQKWFDETLNLALLLLAHRRERNGKGDTLEGSYTQPMQINRYVYLKQTCFYGDYFIMLILQNACSPFCPETFHSHWRGVGQHSTGHNQLPDQHLCEGEAGGIWWSHQILTGFLIHAHTFFMLLSLRKKQDCFPANIETCVTDKHILPAPTVLWNYVKKVKIRHVWGWILNFHLGWIFT